METSSEQDQVSAKLLSFIRNSFLAGDPSGELSVETPLLEFGILNSLNTAEMIAYIRDEFGVNITFDEVTVTTFKSVESLGSVVNARRASGAARP
jgi:clorobiocin biosynthesis protein CloN5